MKPSIIKWTVTEGETLVWEKPERLSSSMNEQYKKSLVRSCWASGDFLDKTFVIKSPFDIHLSYYKPEKKIALHPNKSTISETTYNNLFRNDVKEYTDHAVIQMGTRYAFMCDKPCTITLTPPFNNLDYKDYDSNTRVVSGTFNIFDWQRTLSYALEWLDTSKDLIIKTGQPLFYVTFNTENLEDEFELQYTEDIEFFKMIEQCRRSRNCFAGWDKMDKVLHLGSTKELTYKNREVRKSKCPFSSALKGMPRCTSKSFWSLALKKIRGKSS